MIFKDLVNNDYVDDTRFDQVYPQNIKNLSARHWTPVSIAKMATEFLVKDANTKVLDIGSGVGKFCFVGAAVSKGRFYGVEQRRSLVNICDDLIKNYGLLNVEFLNTNITNVSFAAYDAFYFFNPFYENIDTSLIIDHTVKREEGLFLTYSDYVYTELNKAKIGTRLVTYHSIWDDVPKGYQLEYRSSNGSLSFWTKTSHQN